MKRTIKQMIRAMAALTGKVAILSAAVAAGAILPSLGEDSAFARGTSAAGRLDLRTGVRIATEGAAERITYSPRWGNAASCAVAENGRAALVAAATAEGETTWTPQGVGGHTLTHTAGSTTYTAQFAVLGDGVALHGGVLAAGETWSANKTHLVTTALTVPSGVSLTIEAGAVVKFMPGASLTVTSGGSCTARGVIFTHVNDDTVGGDTLYDGDAMGTSRPAMGDYTITGIITDDDSTEYRYMPPQTLTSNISSNTRLRGYRTYIVSNSVTVASGATLTLQPGTILKFNTGCSLTVNGTLDAQGTRAAPIVFTSLKDDAHGGDTNGDGDKTYAQGGDWYQIRVSGRADFNYSHILYNASSENYGGLEAYGGTVNFDNSEIAHTKYECVNAHSSGTLTARNSIFRDSSLGFGYYGSGRVKAYNCVFADLTTAIRQSGKTLTNCIFYRCLSFTDQNGDGSTYSHCVFFNPTGYGAQSYSKCGSNGNVWGDPLFADPDNGDFKIQKGSPCVNAGDASVAPEFDYYNQPRDDKPDIGIYELVGNLMAANDMAAVGGSPSSATATTIGDTLAVSYSVANVGKQAISGSWRDKVSLVSADGGYSIDLGTVVQTGAIAVGATNTFSAAFTVPTEAEGTWRVAVNVNVERDVYEGTNVANNAATSVGTVEVSLPARAAADGFSGTAARGAPASAKFALDGAEAMVARIDAPAGTVVYLGSGFMPSASTYSARAVVGADGGLIGIPAGVTTAYILVETASSQGAAFTMTLESAALAVQGVTPATLPYTGTTGLVIDGANFAEGCKVELGGAQFVAAVVSPTRLTAQIDCSRLTAGATYDVKVVGADAATATLPRAVKVANVPAAPKLKATLDAPASVRRGRTLTVYIDYENVGNADLPAPIFELISEGQVFKVDGNAYTNSVKVMGLSAEAPVGTLRPGEPQRLAVPVTVLAENVKWKLRSYHAAQEGAKNTKFSLRELYDDDWVIYHVSDDDATVAKLRTAIGATYADYYTNLGAWLGTVEQQTMEYEALKSEFGRYQYLKASGMLDTGKDDSPAEGAENAAAGGTRSSAVVRLLGNAACDHMVAVSPGEANPNEADGTLWRWCTKCGKWTLVIGKEWAETDGPNYITKVVYEKDFSKTAKTFIICHGNENSITTTWMGTMALAICSRMQGDVNVFGVNWGKGAHSILGNPYGSANSIKEVVEKLEDYLDGVQFNYAETTLIGHSHGAHVLANLAVRWSKAKFKRFVGLDASTTDNWVHLFNGLSPSKWIKNIRGSVTGTAEFYKSSWDMSLEKKEQLFGDFNFLVFNEKDLFEYATGGAAVFTFDAETYRHGNSYRWFTMSILSGWPHVGFNFEGSESWKVLTKNNGMKDIVNPGQGGFAGVIRGNRIEMLSALRTDSNHDNWRYSDTVLSEDNWKSAEPIRRTASNLARTIDYHIATDVLPDTLAGKSRILIQSENCADNKTIPYMTGSISAFGNPNPNPWPWKNDLAYGVWLVDYEGIVQDDSSAASRFSAVLSGSGRIGADTLKELLNGKTAYVRRVGQTFVENPALSPLLVSGTPFILPECGDDGKASVRVRFDNDCFGKDKPLIYRGENGDVQYRRVIAIAGAGVKLKSTASENALPEVYEWDIYQDDNFVMREVTAIPANAVAVISKSASAKKSASLKSARLLAAAPTHELSANALKPGEVVQVTADKNGNWSISLNCTESYTTAEDDELVFNRFELTDAGSEDGAPRFQNNNTICDVDTVTVSGTLPMTTDADGNLVGEGKRYTVQLTVSSSENEDDVTTCVLDVRATKDDDPGEDEDNKSSTEPKSCDPNEMVGPEGVGEQRMVKPGDWLTYTIYFENKSDAEAAAACVEVFNPLSDALDWASLEMLDVGFNNTVDNGLLGLHEGMSEKALDGTNTTVRTEFAVAYYDEEGNEVDADARDARLYRAVAQWYLRIIDPNGDADGWPLDMTGGFLPPNDEETHCGEGYIKYRIRVRDDAPANTVIANSATIVFDHYNDPIETDPAWWNTVGTLGAAFAESEVAVDEGETIRVKVSGGSDDAAASVKVYLTYNTAAAADLDLAKGAVDGVVPKGGLKFPLMLTWKKGEVGEKIIEIPTKLDKTVEDDEFFTLQLADAVGMDVGEERVCTVTIRDPSYAALAAKVADGTATKTELSAWNKLQSAKAPYVRGLADPADGGKVSGSALCAAGKKVTLKATANKEFTFEGWSDGESVVATTATLVIDRTAKPAANTKTSTTIVGLDGDVTYYAVFKSYPKVAVDVGGTGTGKVTGAGKYLPGKKVTLKATADTKDAAATATKPATVKSVFMGWYDGEMLLSQDASYSFTMPSNDVEYVAKFVTAAEDAANITAAVNGVELRRVEGNAPYQTNVWAGVYMEWPVEAEAMSLPTVKVAGLPSGLKFTAKPVTSKVGSGASAVIVTNVPANTIYGVPTAASKVNAKTGEVTPSAVKVTVTTAGKSTQTYLVNVVVDALPAWAVGTFDGGGDNGQATLTVSAAGKISGKMMSDGLTWALSAASFTDVESPLSDVESPSFLATVIGKSGKMAITNALAITSEALGADGARGVGVLTGDVSVAVYQNLWKFEPWKTVGKSIANVTYDYEAVDAAGNPGELTLKLAANGTVTAKGVFTTGKNERTGKDIIYTASGTAVLVPTTAPDETGAFAGVAWVYFPPKGAFAGYVECIEVGE